jgi:hypothetical protein
MVECLIEDRSKPTHRASCLQAQIDGNEYFLIHALLMQAHLTNGEKVEARRHADWLVAHRGQALIEMQKYEPQMFNVAALNQAELGLIEWSTDSQEVTQAPLRLEMLKDAWKQAPEDSPMLRRLQQIEAGRLDQ